MPGEPNLTNPLSEKQALGHSGIPTTRLEHHPGALALGSQIEEYRIDRVLGAGGFGITYRAIDRRLKTHVALKEYFPRSYASRAQDGVTVVPNGREISYQAALTNYEWGAERYLEEARLLARIRHPNVVRVSRYFAANGTAYIVMDYEEGLVLGEMLAGRLTLPEDRLLKLLRELLPALEAVHAEGFLHRDIKPDNLLVRARDESLVLIDFGAARRTFDTLSHEITCLVTPGYSPPEQYARNPIRYGPRTDIYSMGAVLYRCISGILPPPAAERLIEDDMPPPAAVAENRYNPTLLKIIERALALRPQDRFQDITEIKEILGMDTHRDTGSACNPLPRRHSRWLRSFRAGLSDRRRESGRFRLRLPASTLREFFPSTGSGPRFIGAAVCLLALAAAIPTLWRAEPEQKPANEIAQGPTEHALKAPDLSTLEFFESSLTAVARTDTPSIPSDNDVGTAPEIEGLTDEGATDQGPAEKTAHESNLPIEEDADTRTANLADADERESQIEEPPATEERIARWLGLARQSLEDFRLSTPPENNANHYFSLILSVDSEHPEALRGKEQIAERYRVLAEKSISRNKQEAANRYIDLGLRFDPDSEKLLVLRDSMVAPESAVEEAATTQRTAKQTAKALFSDVKRLFSEKLPPASPGETRDLGIETTNR